MPEKDITFWKKPIFTVGDLQNLLSTLDPDLPVYCTDGWRGHRMTLHAAEHNRVNTQWFGEIWVQHRTGRKISLVNREEMT